MSVFSSDMLEVPLYLMSIKNVGGINMETKCCDQPLHLFSDYNNGPGVTAYLYHCDICDSFYGNMDFHMATMDEIEETDLEKMDSPHVRKNYEVYKRLSALSEKNPDFNMYEQMDIFNHCSHEEADEFIQKLAILELQYK